MKSKLPKWILLAFAIVSITGLALADDKGYRPDPWITAKAKIALATDEDVSATEVNVDTVDGTVTLHGKVASPAEKTRAEEIAKRIEGVAKVRNLLQVVPDSKRPRIEAKDEEIKDRVEVALNKDAELKDSSIKVKSVNNGVVLLAGKATTLSDHVRAVRDARWTAGVRRVMSEVESPNTISDREIWYEKASVGTESNAKADMAASKKGMTDTMSDAWITTATKMRLMASNDTPAMSINVDTDNGVVTLFGIVPSDAAKRAAEAEASKVNGVRSVVNSLEVVPDSAQDYVAAKDDEAQAAAEKSLERSDSLKNVDVTVKNGVARLTGTVPSESDRLRASVLVRSSRGVRSVQNDAQVRMQ